MRILELCLSSGFGGLEMYMAKVAAFLPQSEHQVRVIVKKNSFLDQRFNEMELERDYLDVKFHHFPIMAARKLASYIQKYEIDIIHMHHGKDLFLCVLAKLFSRRGKLVYTRQMNLTHMKKDFYHRFIYKHVDAYIVITQYLYEDAIKYLPIEKKRVQLLYYGVPAPPEEQYDCPAYIEAQGYSADVVKVAVFGRIEEIKCQHLVVQAVTRLIREGLNVQAALIGHVMDNNYFEQMQQQIKHDQLEADIRYLGFHKNPTTIMSCFDVIVLATRCETFGLVLPEAMRAGTCVVGTNCGGVPEIIQHNETGLLFMPDDVENLTDQLRRLVTDPDYRLQLALAGKTDADNRFSEEKHFRRLMEIFDEVCAPQ